MFEFKNTYFYQLFFDLGLIFSFIIGMMMEMIMVGGEM